MNRKEFIDTLLETEKILVTGKELINEEKILDFQDSSKHVIDNIDEIMKEGRVLRLGIVGEVKAGKSSFLNAILFDGKEVLPKAATPMTAALTRISYAEEPKAEVVFYNKNDWDAIKARNSKYEEIIKESYRKYIEMQNNAKKKGAWNKKNPNELQKFEALSLEEYERINRDTISMPEEYRACTEVYRMAEKKGINVYNLLGEKKTIELNTDGEGAYFDQLDEYVGADGKYTPIVNYTEIQIDNEMLKGIEVIDTPGLNDPIKSRSRTTKKFLVKCDAVFLLGYGGQFLGEEDMNFITSTLPEEGISKAVLIASKFDSMIQQYPSKKGDRPTFKQAYTGSRNNCEKMAKENICACHSNISNAEILKTIRKSLESEERYPVKCVSSLAYSAAQQLKESRPYGVNEN